MQASQSLIPSYSLERVKAVATELRSETKWDSEDLSLLKAARELFCKAIDGVKDEDRYFRGLSVPLLDALVESCVLQVSHKRSDRADSEQDWRGVKAVLCDYLGSKLGYVSTASLNLENRGDASYETGQNWTQDLKLETVQGGDKKRKPNRVRALAALLDCHDPFHLDGFSLRDLRVLLDATNQGPKTLSGLSRLINRMEDLKLVEASKDDCWTPDLFAIETFLKEGRKRQSKS